MGRIREALGNYRQDVAIAEKLLHNDPSNEQSRDDLAYGLIRVGDMLFKLASYSEALAKYKRSQELRASDVQKDPSSLWKRSSFIESKAKICKTLAAMKDSSQAKEVCADALSMMQATTVSPDNAVIRSFFGDTFADLGDAQAALAANYSISQPERQRAWESARGLYVKSHEVWQDLAKRNILGDAEKGKDEIVSQKIASCDSVLR
jgi:tetratricopeptide (TPR) repeat protein